MAHSGLCDGRGLAEEWRVSDMSEGARKRRGRRVEAGEVEITLGVCGEMPGPVRSTRSSFVSRAPRQRHAPSQSTVPPASARCLWPARLARSSTCLIHSARRCHGRAACNGQQHVTWAALGRPGQQLGCVNQEAAPSPPLISIRSLAPERAAPILPSPPRCSKYGNKRPGPRKLPKTPSTWEESVVLFRRRRLDYAEHAAVGPWGTSRLRAPWPRLHVADSRE